MTPVAPVFYFHIQSPKLLQKESKILASHAALCLGRESLSERPGEAKWDREEGVRTNLFTFSSAYVCVCVGLPCQRGVANVWQHHAAHPHIAKKDASWVTHWEQRGQVPSLLISTKRQATLSQGCGSAHHIPLPTLRCSLLLSNWLG